jgi:chromosome segregation ATPase
VHDVEGSGSASASSSRGRGGGGGGGGAGGFQITEYNGKRSRYAPNAPPSTSSQDVPAYGNSGLLDSGGGGEDIADRRAQLTAQIETAKGEMGEVESQLQAKDKELRAVRSEQGEKKRQKAEYHRAINSMPRELKDKIASLERNRDDVKKRLSKTSESERAAKIADYIQAFEAHMQGLEAGFAQGLRNLQFQTEVASANHCWQLLMSDIEEAAEAVADAKEGLKAFQAAEKAAKLKREDFQTQQGKATRELEAKTHEMGGRVEFGKMYAKALQAFPENDIEALALTMEELSAEIQASVDNPEVLRRYEELKGEADKAAVELQKVQQKLDNYLESYRERIDEWKQNVHRIADRLNVSFERYMGALQYQGEVSLVETDMISNYEMRLMVSFRQESGMVELSGHRHSGGERAVSTVMYLMALQEMTSSPFRVVDEINQGEWG